MEKPEAHDDAQRAMEQKALRNVRGLVDKIEQSDRAEKVLQKRLLAGFAALVVIVGVLVATGVIDLRRGQSAAPVVVAPPKPPAK